ncbi:hypothetical protein DICPUDRAFT_76956 [Dictyostelium purpureum]|uniref:Uncharacterized protein n=1 Tax=Dictyostelium purpureum TaxID=5786 RepID=F0ZF63_DICPU|nr:uncharacterized protein DICPUDRAFT_76956 [Dictyostelium purpureum]EGC37398.1 hypothetical protein DICPUDRAFT_76956 [Dictyostelium purpureum]|eukprot:XP_003286051.1 hypothetical protein DICPUDRAFT_76956 [Dictyostelium purpureum]
MNIFCNNYDENFFTPIRTLKTKDGNDPVCSEEEYNDLKNGYKQLSSQQKERIPPGHRNAINNHQQVPRKGYYNKIAERINKTSLTIDYLSTKKPYNNVVVTDPQLGLLIKAYNSLSEKQKGDLPNDTTQTILSTETVPRRNLFNKVAKKLNVLLLQD